MGISRRVGRFGNVFIDKGWARNISSCSHHYFPVTPICGDEYAMSCMSNYSQSEHGADEALCEYGTKVGWAFPNKGFQPPKNAGD